MKSSCPSSLARGYLRAQSITKKYAKTFYLASLFLDRELRRASYAVYALCRLSDESVDDLQQADPDARLAQLRGNIADAYGEEALSEELLEAFRQTVTTYAIPKGYFDELIEGMQMDLDIHRYRTFQELYEYCYKVAGVVGLIMRRILAPQADGADTFAVALGIAMQLTNILRDIREDYARGRIYLPQEELAAYGVREEDLIQPSPDTRTIALLRFQIARARRYYTQASEGIAMLKDARGRFVVRLMQAIYAEILGEIERMRYQVGRKRAYVGGLRKIMIAVQVLGNGGAR
jgi:phytoene synthase